MKRRRGRPARQYNIRVRTVRREPIDFDALARAALEQAAMDQRTTPETPPQSPRRSRRWLYMKDGRHDQLA
jgi:hypothetical protein